MLVYKIGEVTTIKADAGMAIRRIGLADTHCKTAYLAPNDSPENWEDCMEDGSTMKYSTLKIKRELDSLIREDGVSAWRKAKSLLSGSDLWDEFFLANNLSADDAAFKAACAIFIENGIVTQEELDALLPKCIWTAE